MVRAILILLSILVQIAVFSVSLVVFSDIFTIIEVIMLILSIFIVLSIVYRSKDPGNKILWIILILAFPVLGTTLYILLGHNSYRSKRLKALYYNMNMIKEDLVQDDNILDEIKKKDKDIYTEVNYISEYAGYPIYRLDNIEYFKTGDEAYESIIEELNKAEKYIFMEYFTISDGKMWQSILDILESKSKEGLDVRIIYDDVGSAALLPKDFRVKLYQRGIEVICFNELKPVISTILNNRDHRKITVIDGKVAFCGGFNIADEYINKKKRFGYWKDCAVKIEGDAALSFTAMFLEIWNVYYYDETFLDDYRCEEISEDVKDEKRGYVCPYAENPLDTENVGENIYINILNKANDYVYIFTPYLIPDTDMLTSLTLAAKRGVDVRIILPGIPDKKIIFTISRSYYKVLLEAGVKIYEFAPGFLHSKAFVSDDKVATVGTINLDYRSLYTHFECGAYIYNSNVIYDIKKDVLETIELSRQVTLNDIKTPILRNFTNSVLRLFAPLL